MQILPLNSSMSKNKKLNPIEKNTLKQFAIEGSKIFQSFQKCTTYKSVMEASKNLESKFDKNFRQHMKKVQNKLSPISPRDN